MSEPTPIRARRIPPEGFERKDERYALELEMNAQILIPEETFRPQLHVGRCEDLSRSGLKLRLDRLPPEFYQKLIARPRFIRLSFLNPVTKIEAKVTGRIMWIDYHKPPPGEQLGTCHVGIYLDPREGDLSEYHRLVESIEPAD